MEARAVTDWRLDGVRVVHADELDVNTPPNPEEVRWVDDIHRAP